jgi:hypothetical protein
MLTAAVGDPSRAAFSGHIFQPLTIASNGQSGTTVQELNCSTAAQFDVPGYRGAGTVAQGKATAASDKAPLLADVSWSAIEFCQTHLLMLS